MVHDGAGEYDALLDAPVVPDIESYSWGSPVPLPEHLYETATGSPARLPSSHPETIVFRSAGNNAPFPTFVDEGRYHPSLQVVGGGFPGYADQRSWTAYDFASWMCRPVARSDSVTGVDPRACGTSLAAPTVAGTAASALLELRRSVAYAGGNGTEAVAPDVTRQEFLDALRAAATYRVEQLRFGFHEEPSSTPLVADHEHLSWGHGWLDSTRVAAVLGCLVEGRCPEKSDAAQRWNTAREDARRAQSPPR